MKWWIASSTLLWVVFCIFPSARGGTIRAIPDDTPIAANSVPHVFNIPPQSLQHIGEHLDLSFTVVGAQPGAVPHDRGFLVGLLAHTGVVGTDNGKPGGPDSGSILGRFDVVHDEIGLGKQDFWFWNDTLVGGVSNDVQLITNLGDNVIDNQNILSDNALVNVTLRLEHTKPDELMLSYTHSGVPRVDAPRSVKLGETGYDSSLIFNRIWFQLDTRVGVDARLSNVTVTNTPEPSCAVFTGLMALAFAARRRSQR